MNLNAYKNDIVAGFSVFLLSLPLCLGIAIASNFPPISGIFTAIIGGIVASFVGSAPLTIKGPAAGLIVMVLAAVQELGKGDPITGYKLTLAVGAVAGVLQILIAYFKKAIIAEVIPPFVIHGMLAAIGVIIIAKQAYVLIGVTPTVSMPLDLLFDLPRQFLHINPVICGLGLMAFMVILVFPKFKRLAFIPSSIVILAIMLPLSLYFHLGETHTYSFLGKSYALGPEYLVNLPFNFFDALQFPDFSQIWKPSSLKYILMFTLLGSIESLLTVCAVDAIAEGRGRASLNKDLQAVGIANVVSSCVGGLPMISEIVRSKANIDYGATSTKANFFHGLFMLIAVIVFPTFIKLIPLSALAALLIFVGISLASPKHFLHAYEVGRDQLLIFLTTFLVTLKTDLLIGVFSGVLLKIMLHWGRGYTLKGLFLPVITTVNKKDQILIQIEGPLTFISYLKLKKLIEKLAKENKKLVISFGEVTYIDHTVMNKIQTLKHQLKDVECIIEDNQQLVPFYNHPLAARGK